MADQKRWFGVNTIELEQPAPQGPPRSAGDYPDSVKSRYFVQERDGETRFYRDYKGEDLAFRVDRANNRLVTKGEDISTVRDIIAVAEVEGWKSVRVGGSRDFRREAWIEAASREIDATGHKPTDLDRQEAEKRHARRNDLDRRDVEARSAEPSARAAGGPAQPGPPDPPTGPRGPGSGRQASLDLDQGARAPDSNVLSLEVERVTRSTRAVLQDGARTERDEVRLAQDQALGRPREMARDEARLNADEARLGNDRARLSDAAQAIYSALSLRIDKDFTGLTGLEKELLKDFTAGLLAAREQQVGRLQDPSPAPAPAPDRNRPSGAAATRLGLQAAVEINTPEPEIPLPRQREAERTL
jgi:hypothetical protein